MIAPRLAVETRRRYFASKPRVWRGGGGRHAARRRAIASGIDIELEQQPVRVDRDRIAFLDERDHAADVRLRRDVPDDHAPRAAREAAVGDEADGFAEALPDQRRGGGEHLLHAGPAFRAFVADHDAHRRA